MSKKKKFIKNIFSSEYETLKKNFIDETFNLFSKELKEDDSCYLISTHWIRTFIYYLNIISQESNNEENDNELGEILFQFSKTFNLYYKPNLDLQKFFIFAPAILIFVEIVIFGMTQKKARNTRINFYRVKRPKIVIKSLMNIFIIY